MEFKLGTDIKDAETQVRQRIGNIRRNLPNDIKDPVMTKKDSRPVTQKTLAEGAWLALAQAGRLLSSGTLLFDAGDAASGVVLAMFGAVHFASVDAGKALRRMLRILGRQQRTGKAPV